MFALGFLLLIGVFVLLLTLVSKAFPAGLARSLFVVGVLSAIAMYPFFYKITPSYHAFLELCESPERSQIAKRQPVDYVLFEGGYSSDCTKGPGFIGDKQYLGFDCLRADKGGTALFRYAKKSSWKQGCDIECFDVIPLDRPDAPYEWKHRQGLIEGKAPLLTYDGTRANGFIGNEPEDSKLFFQDRVLWSGGEVAFARDYTYRQYGNGWAKILGLASGSAPSMSCRVPFLQLDIRDVFHPKAHQ